MFITNDVKNILGEAFQFGTQTGDSSPDLALLRAGIELVSWQY